MAPSEWGVEIGPVSSMKFREDAATTLQRMFPNIDAEQTQTLLAKERFRVVDGLSRNVADALVKRLDTQKTAAAVIQGHAKPVGAAGAFRYGLPLIALAVGAALGVIVGFGVGIGIGVVAAAGLGFMNAKRVPTTLAEAPVLPVPPADVEDAPQRIKAVWPKLDAKAREPLKQVIEAGFALKTRLMNEDDLVALAAGGADSGMGQAAAGLITEAVRVAEMIAQDGSNSMIDDKIKSLQRLSHATSDAVRELAELSSALEDPNAVNARIDQGVESLQQTVNELKTVV